MITVDAMRETLFWCSVINLGLFFVSFLVFKLGHDWVYRHHGKWYKLPEEKFNETYYAMMVFYKTCILFFNVVPYIALRIVG
jgi:hypothetical protein